MKKTLILLHALVLFGVAGFTTTAIAKECDEAQQQAVHFYTLSIPQPAPLKTQYVFGIVLNGVSGDNAYLKPKKAPRLKLVGDTDHYIDCTSFGVTAGALYACHTADGVLPEGTGKQITISANLKLADLGACTYKKTISLKTVEQFFPEFLDVDLLTDEKESDCKESNDMVCPQPGFAFITMPLINSLWDFDGDGLRLFVDKCPLANGEVCTVKGKDSDQDGDGVGDSDDNCSFHINADQQDTDNDGYGDPCDLDRDDDGKPNHKDNCHLVVNKDQADADSDGIGDACDDGTTAVVPCEPTDTLICATVPGTYCDPEFKQCLSALDTDGDGTPDVKDQCPAYGIEGDPCGTALPAIVPPTPPTPPASTADGGGCSLQTSAPEHSTGVYLLLSFIAVLSALGITKTTQKS